MTSITTSVVQTLTSPPLNLCQLLPAGYDIADQGTMDRPDTLGLGPASFSVGVAAFGIAWNFTTIAPGMGRRLGYIEQYEDRLLQLVVEHRFGDGTVVVTQVHEAFTPYGFVFFNVLYPLRVGYSIFPGCLTGLYWILVG